MSEEPKIAPDYSLLSDIDLADAHGRIKAKIAPLTETEEQIKAEIINRTGLSGAMDGKLFHINVSTSDRKTVDKDALIAKLGTFMKAHFLAAFVAKNTKHTPVTTIRVTARLREG